MRGILAAALATGLLGATPAAALADDTTRYVAVAGSSSAANDCTNAATPCTLARADDASATSKGDTIVVASGAYSINETFTIGFNQVVTGAPGQPRPRIATSTNLSAFEGNGPHPTLRDLVVEGSAAGQWLVDLGSGGVIAGVLAITHGNESVPLKLGSIEVHDSAAVMLATGGNAIWAEGFNSTLRNVTAWAPGGIGLLAREFTSNDDPEVAVINSIVRGGDIDLLVDNGARAGLSFSNFDPKQSRTLAGSSTSIGTIDAVIGNQEGDPLLVAPASGDVHQRVGSPTINAGTAAIAGFSQFDFDGDARISGDAPDIGADELVLLDGRGDGVAPVFLKAPKFSRSSFPAAKSGPAFKPARTYGATITYTLSEPATTTFGVQRPLAGRKSGKKCVKPTRKNRKKKRCTRWSTLKGSFADKGTSGVNKVKFSGRLRGKRLKPGKYRLTAVAKDPAGLKSKTSYRSFRIVR